jgi:transcriptional regulator with XRE-family HTH domain
MFEQKNVKPGIPMVQISGSAVRSLREKQGLTQLYLATAVGVTTETISRWERQDAPTLKEENALKLADVLAVPLEDIFAVEECVSEVIPVPCTFLQKKKIIVAILLIVFGGVLGLIFVLFDGRQVTHFSAQRIIPAHTAPDQTFPVLINVELSEEGNSSLLIKEQLPQGCTVIRSMPEATAAGQSFLKWIARDSSSIRLFAYLAKCSVDIQNKKDLLFQGSLLIRQSRRQDASITGPSRLQLSRYHWADSDQDNMIDDEELLAVYDEFDLVKGLNIDVEEIESIWMGTGYKWNQEQSVFEIFP